MTQQRIVLGVCGGIAAYKVASLLRLFKEAGHHVDVVPTAHALEFVGRATWEALSGQPVTDSVFEAVDTVNHVRLGQQADLVVIAPATADFLGRAAAGLANDLLTNTLLATRAPVLMAPAMHTEMWEHAATQANVATLRGRGVRIVEPAVGRLTGADSGPGRLPDPEDLYAAATALLPGAPVREQSLDAPAPPSLAGRTVVVSAGGTREPLDPVRYLGNRSSGKQGVALARALLDAGAHVRFVSAHVETPLPEGVELTTASTAAELREAVRAAARGADAVVMAAAVADFRPASLAETKIKKSPDGGAPTIELVRNPDILAELVADRARGEQFPPVIVGFAAETGDARASVDEYGRAKLAAKGCELLVVNEVGVDKGFGREDTSATLLWRNDDEPGRHVAGTKDDLARALVEVLSETLNR
ncbi:bifunctional phosphopantothenoylcysteine decarboxylase/phosphopantothenate--cysteine ligase CoaBC [Zhihengliuella flava]|uniref:Coenzyme A biosynthesis bifunctional protein CoaBC n=1 Tax=Zhihengliuella flava TaxID=1285193 RepID=A0A931D408_9MICC|nr:bifunctional phosphopantothenoylcysteine decarboxylase/phosphopantothenate--cysteine ligase CoaBC [Zhihengliuella flava]MBG6083335.1 phosphopantothenoylcysteine decarboxylase/phosphopantothenate--cysteine ligase [Zhihengliuella flava]